MAIYWQDREWWRGSLTAFGGSSSQGGNGGAGTVYLVVRKILYSEGTMCCYPRYVLRLTLVFFVSRQDTQHGVNNRTLIFDNNNLSPSAMEITDYSSPYTNGGRAWILPIDQEFELEEVHILRRAHVALHPNITR